VRPYPAVCHPVEINLFKMLDARRLHETKRLPVKLGRELVYLPGNSELHAVIISFRADVFSTPFSLQLRR